MEDREYIISKIINLILYSVVCIMPFVIMPNAKRSYLRGKVLFMFVTFVLLLAISVIGKKITLCKENVIAIIFFATLAIATIFSDYKKIAMFGNQYRNEGLLMIGIYILLYIIATNYIVINKTIIKIVLAFPSVMAIYCDMQMLGIDPIQNKLFGKSLLPTVSIGTIGNYNFVSSYFCLFIFVSMALYIYKKDLYYLIASIIIFSGLLSSRTRGGWLAFIIVSIIGFLLMHEKKKKIIPSIILLFSFVVTLFSLNYLSDNKIIDRAGINNFIEMSERQDNNIILLASPDNEEKNIKIVGSVSSRMNILKVYFKVFKDHPLLGQGPDTMLSNLSDNYKEELNNHITLYGESIDKAHNEYVEYAVSGGIFTVLTYGLMLFFVLYGLIKNREKEDAFISLMLVLGYIIQAIFNISVVMVAPIFWIFLGVATKTKNKYYYVSKH